MQQQRHLLIFIFTLITGWVSAQEVQMPYAGLKAHPKSEKPLYKRAGVNFPLVDFFVKGPAPDYTFWEPTHGRITNRNFVLNVLDSNGNLSASGDVLTVKPMDVTGAASLFISFNYATGVSFSAGDSLVVEAKNKMGEWIQVWKSEDLAVNNREVIISLDINLYATNQFAFRFVNYSAQIAAWNQETYLVNKVVCAEKWPVSGVNEFLTTYHSADSVPSWEYFSGPDVNVIPGLDSAFEYGNLALLNAFDFEDKAYNTGFVYGGADTLYTHPVNLLETLVSDTMYLYFTLRSLPANLPADSFQVEFYNNLGQWVRIFAITGKSPSNFTTYMLPVNNGRYRHGNFRVRFIFKTEYNTALRSGWLLGALRLLKRIELPLFDDFSNSRIHVSNTRWKDNFVYVNNDFPVDQPSLNVATFDGLDANGNPYSKFATKGICDVLTSQSMNLKGLSVSDSIILSYYYQYEPQGNTNQVYPDDVFYVEIRNNAMAPDSFIQIGTFNADDSLLFKFTYFEYTIKDPVFLHEDFQIRFRNKGSLTGNLSQWHLDYVRFNKGRKSGDAIKDIALSNTPHLYLGPYAAMPWNHYNLNKGKYSNLPDTLRLVNHDNQAYAVDYFRSVMRPDGDTLDKFNNILPTLLARSDSSVEIKKTVVFNTSVVADSIEFKTLYKIKISGNQNDNVTGNDTCSVSNIFSNYFAYDDGTAEGGYGIKNKINVGASLKYTLEEKDTLVGVYIFFNQSEKDVSTQSFTLKVWNKISPLFQPATSDEVIYSQDIAKPTYTNTINGFTSYRFIQPVAVSDSFFIGWEQTNAYVLNIGLDKNYPFGINPNMAYKMDGRWYPSEIEGALMIRPILKKFMGVATGINNEGTDGLNIELNQLTLFPNPASNGFSVKHLENPEDFSVTLFDLSGKELEKLSQSNGVYNIESVNNGMYLVVFQNIYTDEMFTRKLMIHKN